MEKLFNTISMIVGIIGGSIVSFLGGWDGLAITLITLMGLDYITGVLKAIYTKQLSSEIRNKGDNKKSTNTYSRRNCSTFRNEFRRSCSA